MVDADDGFMADVARRRAHRSITKLNLIMHPFLNYHVLTISICMQTHTENQS